MSARRTAFPLGKEMWKKELNDHQKRLHSVKPTPTLVAGPPAATPASGRPTIHSGRRHDKPSSAPDSGNTDSAASATNNGTASKGKRIDELSPDDQKTCEAMIAILQKLSTSDSKSILEELFVGCEMKRLLSQYTGVYPDPPQDGGAGAQQGAAASGQQERPSNGDANNKKAKPAEEKPHSPSKRTPPAASNLPPPAPQAQPKSSQASPAASPKTKRQPGSQTASPKSSTLNNSTTSQSASPLAASTSPARRRDDTNGSFESSRKNSGEEDTPRTQDAPREQDAPRTPEAAAVDTTEATPTPAVDQPEEPASAAASTSTPPPEADAVPAAAPPPTAAQEETESAKAAEDEYGADDFE